tara:strand:+ start:157 stop:828 length:672 start_codon:yes stop_codon:yes gene_type:complete
MAYTPPSAAFVDGNTIVSADVDANLEEMGAYINGGVVAGDLVGLSGDGRIKQQHIAHGDYNPIENSLQMVSGVSQGFNSFAGQRAFLVGAPSGRSTGTNPTDMSIQNSTMSFFLDGIADVLLTYHMTPIFPAVGKTTPINNRATAQIYVDGNAYGETTITTRREWSTGGLAVGPAPYMRTPWSGFLAFDNLGSGWHNIGLRGQCQGHFVMMVQWGVTVEAYYV